MLFWARHRGCDKKKEFFPVASGLNILLLWSAYQPRGEAHIPLTWKCCCFSAHFLGRKKVYFCKKRWKVYASLAHAESNKLYQQALLSPFQMEQNSPTLPHSHLCGTCIPMCSSPNTGNCSRLSSWWAWHEHEWQSVPLWHQLQTAPSSWALSRRATMQSQNIRFWLEWLLFLLLICKIY